MCRNSRMHLTLWIAVAYLCSQGECSDLTSMVKHLINKCYLKQVQLKYMNVMSFKLIMTRSACDEFMNVHFMFTKFS